MTEEMHCERCGSDTTLYMSPRCHPGMPVFCLLSGDVLTLECAMCRKLVTRLSVAGFISQEPPEVEAAPETL